MSLGISVGKAAFAAPRLNARTETYMPTIRLRVPAGTEVSRETFAQPVRDFFSKFVDWVHSGSAHVQLPATGLWLNVDRIDHYNYLQTEQGFDVYLVTVAATTTEDVIYAFYDWYRFVIT